MPLASIQAQQQHCYIGEYIDRIHTHTGAASHEEKETKRGGGRRR